MKNLSKAFLRVLVVCALTQCVDALQFSPPLSDVYAVLDKPLWWTCSVLKDGQTAPVTFLWRFQDGDIAQDDTRIAYANGTLYFPKVLNTQIGKYTCIARDSQSAIESLAFLQLAYIANNVTLQATNQPVMLGSSAVLDCKADGRPAPSLSMTLNGQIIARSSRIVITDLEAGHIMMQINNVTYSNAGSYICMANHVTLTQPINSSAAWVVVYGKPVITTYLQDQVVPIGYNVTFNCSANSQPPATLTLLFIPSSGDRTPQQISASQPSVSIDNTKGTFQLLNVGPSRSGVYSCTWYNQYGSAVSQANLMVTGNPQSPVFIVRPVDSTFTEGSDLTLSCSGTGNPGVTVVWVSPSGGVIPSNVAPQSTDGSPGTSPAAGQTSTGATGLLIRNVSRSDSGVYICRLVNSEGVAEFGVYVTILYTPNIITPPESITVDEGIAFSLSCAAVGNPQPTISWTLPSTPNFNLTSANSGVGSNTNEVVLDSGDLSVVKASSFHSGTFTCYASNSVGSTAASASVSVSGVPVFSVTPVSQGVIEGDTVVFQCQVNAYPAAQVAWYYRYIMDPSIQSTDILQYIKESLTQNNLPTDNMTMLQGGEFATYSVINGTSLQFDHVSEGDAGLYLCFASNDHGSAFVAAILRVITLPVFQVMPTDTRVALGSTARLDCFSVGIPVPSQRWLFNQRPIELNSRTSLYINGSLSIANVQESDLGNYTCRATNQAGVRSTSAMLTISKLPYFLTAPTNTTTASGSTASIPCRGNSNTPFQVLWYLSDNSGSLLKLLDLTTSNQNPASSETDRIQMSPQGDLIFKCVEKSDSNWYTCVLSNSDGSIASNSVYLTVDILPSILSTVVTDSLSLGQTGNFTCQATGSPVPVISWLTPVKVEYTEASVGEITVSAVATSQYVNSTLTITALQMDRDAGDWTCKACNEIGCRLQTVTLNLEGNAVIRQLIGQEYDNAFRISCVTAGVPIPNITYSSGGNLITNLTEGHTIIANDLLIQKDKIKSEYTCQTDNGSYEILSYPPGVVIVNLKPSSDSFTVSMTHSEPIPSLTPNKVVLRFAVDGTNVWQNQTYYLSQKIEDYLQAEAGAVIDNSTQTSCGNVAKSSIVKRNTNDDSSAPKDFNVSINSTGTQWVFSITANVPGLKPNTVYDLQATMANILGPGPYSPPVTVQTLAAAPSPVTDVTVSVNNRTATVTWTNPDPLNGQPEDTTVAAQLFNSPPGNNAIATANVSVLQPPLVTFPNLLAGDYILKIFVYNSKTFTTSSVATAVFQVQDNPPLYKPIIEGIKSLNTHTVQLNWTVPSSPNSMYPPITGYIIDVSAPEQGGGDIQKLRQFVNITGNSVSFKNIDSLLGNTTYSMRVASWNSAGIGPYSDSRNVTTPVSEVSQQVADSSASTPWRTVAIVFIVVCSCLIILAVILVVIYQVRIAKIKSVNLDSQLGSDVQLDNKSEEEMQHDNQSRTVEGFENNTILY